MRKINKNILLIILSIVLVIGILGYIFRDSLKKSIVFRKGENVVLKWFNISADTVISPNIAPIDTGCTGGEPNGICEANEKLSTCPSDCAKTNPSINFGLFWLRLPEDGVSALTADFNLYKTAISKQFKMINLNAGPSLGSVTAFGNDYYLALEQMNQIKTISPNSQTYPYRWTVSKTRLSDVDIANNKLDLNGSSATCFLRYQQGANIGTPIIWQNAYVMDISSQCWKDFMVSYIEDVTTRANSDGVILDGFSPNFAGSGTGYPSTITDSDLPANYVNNWVQNINELTTYVKSKIGNKKIIFVAPSCLNDGSANDCGQQFISASDGFMMEAFAFNGVFNGIFETGPFLSVSAFQQKLSLASNAQAQGKIVYLSNRVIPIRSISVQSTEVKALQRFTLSSYLLVSAQNSFYGAAINDSSITDRQGTGAPYVHVNFYDDWGADVGDPKGSYSVNDGIYTREFTKAKVLVNPDAVSKTITISGNYKTFEGADVTGNLVLQARHGEILFPQEDPNKDSTFPEIKSLNLTDGQTIKTNPYLLMVTATDNVAINRVDFYVDDNLVGSSSLPDNNGVYETVWDTSKYHSIVRVEAIDSSGNVTRLSRNTIVSLDSNITTPPIVIVLPKTGKDNIWNQKIDDLVLGLIL